MESPCFLSGRGRILKTLLWCLESKSNMKAVQGTFFLNFILAIVTLKTVPKMAEVVLIINNVFLLICHPAARPRKMEL